MSAPRPEDMRAAFTGLLVAAVVLMIALTTIVHLTNNHYAGEGAHADAAK
ncbi:MAG: hypothetical protein WKG32_08215 [Gemmatimonadaceae bacterium]